MSERFWGRVTGTNARLVFGASMVLVCFAIWLVVQQDDWRHAPVVEAGTRPAGGAAVVLQDRENGEGLLVDLEDTGSPFQSTFLSRYEMERIRLEREVKLEAQAERKQLEAEAKRRAEAERLKLEEERKRQEAEEVRKRREAEETEEAEEAKQREVERLAKEEADRLAREAVARAKAEQKPPPLPPPPPPKVTFSILYKGYMQRTDGTRVALIDVQKSGIDADYTIGDHIGEFELIDFSRAHLRLLRKNGETNVVEVGKVMTWELD